MKILVMNSGSSSLKFQLFAVTDLSVLASGLIEAIGEATGYITLHYLDEEDKRQELELQQEIVDHRAAIEAMTALFQRKRILSDVKQLAGVGHRVVHGGESFHEPILITDAVLDGIHDLNSLAPLHNPANITGIKVVLEKVPDVPQVAVFDTAFHQSIPDYAYLYALPYRLYTEQKVRRYGFHGTSHGYVSKAAAQYLGRSYDSLKIITLHLGNGASAAAINNGVCVDTSMGLTPLEGLVMGTRSGDLDPAILFYLARETGMNINELDTLLNKESGLKGICGNNDMRTIDKLAGEGDRQALLALHVFCYRIKKYIGSYLAVLGGADCLIFTGGIGENAVSVRARCLAGLENLGFVLDPHKNNGRSDGIMEIQSDISPCKILVVPTNEELEIAQQTLALIR
ncbi:MAG: acetate kinase [Desulfocapsa sp.]|nr:MAG: acetate kinase [Desulfocapsa sp.]